MLKASSALTLCLAVSLPLLATGCQTMTLTYSERKLLCGIVEEVRYRPTRETFESLPPEDREFLKRALAIYRSECGNDLLPN